MAASRSHRVRGSSGNVSDDCLPEEPFGFGVVLVAGAEKGNPGAGVNIDTISTGAASGSSKLLFPQRILRHLKLWDRPERPPPLAPERSMHYDPAVIAFDDLDERLELTQ